MINGNLLELGLKIKIELSKDEIGTIRWDVSALIEDIESDFLNELADCFIKILYFISY